jgi:hypothetical protein
MKAKHRLNSVHSPGIKKADFGFVMPGQNSGGHEKAPPLRMGLSVLADQREAAGPTVGG